MILAISAVLFGCFVLDVFLGALADGSFLSDLQEMLVLFAASVTFVAGILRREKLEKNQNDDTAQ